MKSDRLVWVLIGPAVAFLTLFVLLPLHIVLVLGFFRSEQYQIYYDVSLRNYFLILTEAAYIIPLVRSLLMAVSVSATCLILAWPVAYWISHRKYRLIYVMITAAPFMIGTMLRVTALQVILAPAGLLEQFMAACGFTLAPGLMYSHVGTYVGLVYTWAPFAVLVIYLSLLKNDSRLEEAAAVFGASWVRRFWGVVLPANRPGTLLAFLLVFIGCIGASVEATFLGGPDGALYGTFLHNQLTAGAWSRGAAMSFVMLAIALVAVKLVLRWSGGDLFRWTGYGER